ncbi:MAG: hypothetical protein OXT09_26900 [Myxococcales bacterium]|nr:hypothetical protein [Myxococcales bacterium]
MRATWTIEHDWRGSPLPADEHARVALRLDGADANITVDAPFHGDPPPGPAPGRCPGLWNHEVVELFLLGPEDRYTEIEIGPHGHYLALRLHGVRRVIDDTVGLELHTTIASGRWTATARLERRELPDPMLRANAYAIHGSRGRRYHSAAHPVPGEAPDFHRLEHFQPID